MLNLDVVDPVGTPRGFNPVGTRIARLLVDVFGVARHRRHGSAACGGRLARVLPGIRAGRVAVACEDEKSSNPSIFHSAGAHAG